MYAVQYLCNYIHHLCGAQHVQYIVSVLVTHGTLVAYLYTYAPSCCRTSQYRMNLLSSQCLCSPRNSLTTLYSIVSCYSCRLGKLPFCLLPFSLYLIFFIVWNCGVGVFGLIGCKSLSLQSLHCQPFFNNNNL